MHDSAAVIPGTVLCDHHRYLCPRPFHRSEQTLCARQAITSHATLQPLGPCNLLSVSTNLPTLDISYKRNCMMYVLLCLASLTQHHVFKARPFRSMHQNFIPSYGLTVFHCAHVPLCVVCSSVDGHSCCFHLLPIVNTRVLLQP